ncbi:MAG: hypothetical protein ACKVRP_11055 [Bacteroidota bacterium]
MHASALKLFSVLWTLATMPLMAQTSYKEIEVNNGGSITGTVRVTAGTKNIAALAVHKDDKICGRQKPSPRLRIGKNNTVANAIIFIEGIKEGKTLKKDGKYLLNQVGCEYVPHVTVMPFGAMLEIVNSDPVLHNVHAYEEHELGKTVFNIAQPIKGQRTPIKHTTFKKPGLYLATCDAGHPWMSAFVMVADHPYYAVTDKYGRFSLDHVPSGTYTITMWHEGVNIAQTLDDGGKPKAYIFEQPYDLTQQITVEPGGKSILNFEFSVRNPESTSLSSGKQN